MIPAILLAVATVLVGAALPAQAQTAVIVVRHAEKIDESEDSLLSPAGAARAEALARVLASAAVQAVYVTQYQRTALTAGPLAKGLGLVPVVINSDASADLVDRIRKDHPSQVVLIVGHSGSVPRIVRLLGVTEQVQIAHDEYDSLFLVVPRATGPPTMIRLRY